MTTQRKTLLVLLAVAALAAVVYVVADPFNSVGSASVGTDIYTCPMHPSVQSDRPGACPVCGMSLVKKTSPRGGGEEAMSGLQAISLSPTQRVLANITVAKAKRGSIGNVIHAVGVVSYAEPNYRHISMRFPGRLEKLYLSFTGQMVLKGDPVADVYSPEAISAQQEYLLALDAYEQAMRGGQTAVSATALLEQSTQKLIQWGFTEEQIEDLRNSRRVSSVVTIYSQVSGTVVKKSVDPQHYIQTGEDMFDVADLSVVWILLDVYEKDIRFIEVDQPVRITTEAYPGEEFKGRVVFVDPVLDPETRTIRVRTEFSNKHGRLKPNMYVNAAIRAPETTGIVVPLTAVLSKGKRTVVWVEVRENGFEPRDVMLGPVSDGSVVILDGLKEGDLVAETGGFLIDSESVLQQTSSADQHTGHRDGQ